MTPNALTEERLAFLLSEAAGRSHSHLGPDCDPVHDHGDQARKLLPLLA
jgi:hypothetical protein